MDELGSETHHVHRRRSPTPRKTRPKDLVCVRRRVAVASLAAVAFAGLLAGNVTGVIFSPDLEPASSPFPACDARTLTGCGDLIAIVERLIDDQLLHHLTIDHYPEVTPSAPVTSPTTSASPSTTPSGRPSAAPSTTQPRRTPTATPRPTTRPTGRPTTPPTARPAPTASPCFRPGNPQSGHDPCSWPPDGP